MRGCPSAGHGWSCEGPWEVIGRPGVSLGVHGRCLVYLEWLGASSEVLGRSLNVPRGVFGRPWNSVGGPRQVGRGPWTSLEESLRVLGGPWRGPREVPGGPWGGLGGPQNRRCFFRASREGPGEPLGWFWCSEVVLGSVLGSQNVVFPG